MWHRRVIFEKQEEGVNGAERSIMDEARWERSTHSTPRSEARGMLRVDTERRFLPRFKNRGLAPSNVSNSALTIFSPGISDSPSKKERCLSIFE